MGRAFLREVRITIQAWSGDEVAHLHDFIFCLRHLLFQGRIRQSQRCCLDQNRFGWFLVVDDLRRTQIAQGILTHFCQLHRRRWRDEILVFHTVPPDDPDNGKAQENRYAFMKAHEWIYRRGLSP